MFAAGGGDLLSNLTISSGTLNPGFDPGTTNYTASVAPSVATVLVTPTAGDAQASLKVNGATAISGAPRSVALSFGPNPIQVLVTSGDGSNTSRTYGIVVTRASPTITLSPATLPGGMIAQAYSATISASGGTAPYGFAATGLPAGLTLGTGGVLSGTPTTAGSFSVAVTATDANGATGVSSYSLTIAAPVTLSPATLPGGMVGQAYSATIGASGGTAPYGFAATGLPAGLTLGTGGALSGTPTTAGSFSVAVTATDANGATGVSSYSLTIAAPVTLSPAPLPGGMVGQAYSATIGASGGTAPYGFAATGLPAGLTLGTGGALSGTPTTAGSFSVAVTATDANGATGVSSYSLTIAAPVTLAPATLPGGMVGQAYSATIGASGGTAPYGFAATGLPAGLTLGTGGALSGTPTTAGSFSVAVTATDANGATGVSSYSLTIAAPVTLAPAPLPGGMVGQAYSATIGASGGTAPYGFAATGLPAGLTLGTGGALSGTPTTAGSFSVAVTATDANGATGVSSYSLTIMSAAQPLALSPAGGRLSDGTVGRAYSQTITASGGVPPYSFSASGLPQGLSLDASSGAITGTPATAGSYGVVIEVRDAQGATASGSYSLVIAAAPTAFVFSPPSGALPQAMAGEAYSQPIAAAGGTGPKLYGVASGTLPRGLVLNVSTGTLNGPLNAGTEGDYSFTIAVTDGSGATATAAYTLKVVAQQIAVADKSETVVAGEPPADVYLNAGATGGPFTSAAIAYVEPPQAGVARITEGAVAALGPVAPKGFYLTFIPSAEFSGTAKVGYTLTSALGTSNVGIVTYVVELDARAVADKADRLVRDFVSARQSLLANTVETPGLIERRMAATSTQMGSLGLAPSGDGLSVDFATSTAQIEAARRHALGDTGETAPMPRFNAWASASVLAHKQGDSDDGGRDGGWGDFTLVSFGADYLVADRLLLGLALHTDHTSDPSDDGDVHGTGFLFGPYASLELSPSLYLDASLYYGRSWNTVDLGTFEGDFDTTRYMATTKLEGILGFGALTLRPNLKLSYIDESVDDYAVGNDAGESVAVAGFSEQDLRFSAGAKASYALPLDNGWTLTPTFGGSIGVSSGNGGALDDAIGEGLFGTVEAGFGLAGGEGWSLLAAGTLNLEGKGNTAIGGKASLAIPF